jgi:hypothetical protein
VRFDSRSTNFVGSVAGRPPNSWLRSIKVVSSNKGRRSRWDFDSGGRKFSALSPASECSKKVLTTEFRNLWSYLSTKQNPNGRKWSHCLSHSFDRYGLRAQRVAAGPLLRPAVEARARSGDLRTTMHNTGLRAAAAFVANLMAL